MIKSVVFDLDGVIRVGTNPILGVNDTFKLLSEKHIPFMICTNECRYTPSQISDILLQMNIKLPANTLIYTAGLSVRDYLHVKINKCEDFRFGIVGEQGLHDILISSFGHLYVTLNDNNYNTQKLFVIIGTVSHTDIHTIESIQKWIHKGALIITTCCDLSDPSSNMSIGMPNHMIQMACSGQSPPFYSTGKPHPIWAKAILNHFQLVDPNDILFVGDTLYTDIRLAEESGFKSALVLTGNSTKESVVDSIVTPDYIINSIKDICNLV